MQADNLSLRTTFKVGRVNSVSKTPITLSFCSGSEEGRRTGGMAACLYLAFLPTPGSRAFPYAGSLDLIQNVARLVLGNQQIAHYTRYPDLVWYFAA